MTTEPPGWNPLTKRELEVLALTATGITDADTARFLGIRHNTVRTHWQNIRRALHTRSRTHAVALALMNGVDLNAILKKLHAPPLQ